jgi:hypothetical protein
VIYQALFPSTLFHYTILTSVCCPHPANSPLCPLLNINSLLEHIPQPSTWSFTLPQLLQNLNYIIPNPIFFFFIFSIGKTATMPARPFLAAFAPIFFFFFFFFLLPLASTNNVHIINSCTFPLYVFETLPQPYFNGHHRATIEPGKSLNKPYQIFPAQRDGGISFKILKHDSLVSKTTGRENPMSQLEYTVDPNHNGEPGKQLWYDYSNVDCKGESCPLQGHGVLLTTSRGDKCRFRQCRPGHLQCEGAYLWDKDDSKTTSCEDRAAEMYLHLCYENGAGDIPIPPQAIPSQILDYGNAHNPPLPPPPAPPAEALNKIAVSQKIDTQPSSTQTQQPPSQTQQAGGSNFTLPVPTTMRTMTHPKPTGPAAPLTGACKQWKYISSDDTCEAILSRYRLDFTAFHDWNPSVGNTCQFLVVGQAYCVRK